MSPLISCIMRSSVAGALEHVMRLCWADKVPLALFALITLFMLFLGAGANLDRVRKSFRAATNQRL
jgi:hypothetical protein